MVNRKNTAKANEHAAFKREYSGQLPFLGLMPSGNSVGNQTENFNEAYAQSYFF
jgi:hypothetical protein